MKSKFKGISILFALFFILIISLAMVSAEEISTDSNGFEKVINQEKSINSDNSVDLDNSNKGLIKNVDNVITIDNSNSTSKNKNTVSVINSSSKNSTIVAASPVLQSKKTATGTIILCSNIAGKMGKKVNLVASVYDKNLRKVNSGIVTFTLRGKSYKVKVKNGIAVKRINSPFLGIYRVNVKYNGGSAYKASSSRFLLVSDLKVLHRYSKNMVVKKGAKQFYRITLINQYTKKVLKNFKVKFKIRINNKWKTYTLKSNAKGLAYFPTKNLPIGSYNVKICSAYKYIKTNLNAKIIVKKIDYV